MSAEKGIFWRWINSPSLLSKAEIFGLLLIPILMVSSFVTGSAPFSILFDLATLFFGMALFFRETNTLSAVILLVSNIVLIVVIFWSQKNNAEIGQERADTLSDETNYTSDQLKGSRPFPMGLERTSFSLVLINFGLGLLLMLLVLYFVLDSFFFRGAVISIQFLFGSLLLSLTIISFRYAPQIIIIKRDDEENSQNNNGRTPTFYVKKLNIFILSPIQLAKYVLLIILSVMLITSSFAFVGLDPIPPGQPSDNFGGSDRPYNVTKLELSFTLSDDLQERVDPIRSDNTLLSHIFVPEITSNSLPLPELPVLWFLHGIGAYQVDDVYTNIMEMMSSRGAIAVFVEYPDELILPDGIMEDQRIDLEFSPEYSFRYRTLWTGIEYTIEQLQDQSSIISDQIDQLTGDTPISWERSLVVGHSYGGGATPYIATQLLQRLPQIEEMIINLEAPWLIGYYDDLQYDLADLDDRVFISINVYQDDFRFDQCVTTYAYERLFRESSVPHSQLQYSIVRSDRTGYPRLVATHFVPADPTTDSLSYWGVFKRLDAMVGYLQAKMMQNLDRIEQSAQYFKHGMAEMIYMGEWSDGQEVKSMLFSTDPLGLRGGINLKPFLNYYSESYCEQFNRGY